MADFDPDEYLRRKAVPASTSAAFDPDSYLAGKTKAGTVPDAQINRFPQMALDHPVEASNYDPGDLWRAAKSVGDVGSDIVSHPLDTLKNPNKRHEFERGVGDVVTLGYGNKIADKAAKFFGDKNWNPDQEAALAPGYRTTGQVVGSLLPNPIVKAAGMASAPLQRALSAIPVTGAVPGAIVGAAKGVAGYEAAAPAMAGLSADAEGDRFGAMLRAAKNPLGIALGAGLGAIGGSGTGSANKIRDPKTQSGRDIQAIEAVNGQVRPFGEPARGGEFESPEMQGLQKGRAGRHELAAKSVDRVLSANDAQYHAAQQSWGETADNILADHGDETHFATKTHDVLNKLEQDNTVNGVVGDEKLANAITKARAMLKAPESEAPPAANEPSDVVKELSTYRDGAKSPAIRAAIDEQIKAQVEAESGGTKVERPKSGKTAPKSEPTTVYDDILGEHIPYESPFGKHHLDIGDVAAQAQTERNTPPLKMQFEPTRTGPAPELPPADAIGGTGVKVGDFIKTRKILNRMARDTQDPSERYAFGKILDAMKGDAADIDPRIGQLNADYARQMQSLTATNDALFGQAKPVVRVTEGVKQSATARMDRIGEDTKPGMRAEPRIQRFAEARPSNDREVALNRAKQAAERLRYGEPQTSTGAGGTVFRAIKHAVVAPAMAAIGFVHGGLPGAIAMGASGKALENLGAARVRIGLPVAEAVSRNVTGSSAVPANRIMELSRARREEDKKRAKAMLNGAR